MPLGVGFEVDLPLPFQDAVDRVKAALKEQGFGILTEIDLQAAFREKLGREFRPYLILGACNPPLAFSALTADPSVGLLLPCNVTLEHVDDHRTRVRLTDPEAMLSASAMSHSPEMREVAWDGGRRMSLVRAALQQIRA